MRTTGIHNQRCLINGLVVGLPPRATLLLVGPLSFLVPALPWPRQHLSKLKLLYIQILITRFLPPRVFSWWSGFSLLPHVQEGESRLSLSHPGWKVTGRALCSRWEGRFLEGEKHLMDCSPPGFCFDHLIGWEGCLALPFSIKFPCVQAFKEMAISACLLRVSLTLIPFFLSPHLPLLYPWILYSGVYLE